MGVSLSAQTEKTALRQVDTAVEQYVIASKRLCDEYNKCVLDRETYAMRSENLRRRMAQVPELFDSFKRANSDEDRRKALSSAFDVLVPEESRNELQLDFSVLATKPGEREARPIRVGESLPTGSRVAFVVKASKNAFVYLFQKGPNEKTAVLFPDSRIPIPNPLVAGQPLRIPTNGQAFKLNEKDIGTERVFVVASISPIPALESSVQQLANGGSENALLHQLVGVKAEGADCKVRALELEVTPENGCVRERGLELETETSSASLRARSEPGDVTIVQRFSFEHTRLDQYRP